MTRPNRRLPLTALLGFKDAAAELCVSTTTASNQIRRIERDWGCQLTIRMTCGWPLSEAGRPPVKPSFIGPG